MPRREGRGGARSSRARGRRGSRGFVRLLTSLSRDGRCVRGGARVLFAGFWGPDEGAREVGRLLAEAVLAVCACRRLRRAGVGIAGALVDGGAFVELHVCKSVGFISLIWRKRRSIDSISTVGHGGDLRSSPAALSLGRCTLRTRRGARTDRKHGWTGLEPRCASSPRGSPSGLPPPPSARVRLPDLAGAVAAGGPGGRRRCRVTRAARRDLTPRASRAPTVPFPSVDLTRTPTFISHRSRTHQEEAHRRHERRAQVRGRGACNPSMASPPRSRDAPSSPHRSLADSTHRNSSTIHRRAGWA